MALTGAANSDYALEFTPRLDHSAPLFRVCHPSPDEVRWRMAGYVCRFPDGVVGAGLLVLRGGGALAVVGQALAMQSTRGGAGMLYLLVTLLAIALLVGIVTRAAALMACGVVVTLLADAAHPLMSAGHLALLVAMVLLGPGAFSLDARLHGRRVIHLPADKRDSGDGA